MNSESRLATFLKNARFVPPPSENPARTWIGGSTFHKCVSNPDSFIKSLSYKFNGNLATKWGNAFEEVTKHYLEKKHHVTIHTPRSIVGIEHDNNIILSYTPDGLSTYSGASTEVLKNTIDVPDQDELFVLHEYKSPYSRIPNGKWDSKTNGYLSQIKTGLHVIPADFALYYDCVYRICDFYDLGNNHSQILCPNQIELNVDPVDYGLMFFMINKPYPCYDLELTMLNKSKEDQIKSLYEGYKDVITNPFWIKMLYKKILNIHKKEISILDFTNSFIKKLDKYYTNVYITSHDNIKDNFTDVWEYAKTTNMTPVGFVPWKLMYVKELKVDREVDFVTKHIDTLIKVTDHMRTQPNEVYDF